MDGLPLSRNLTVLSGGTRLTRACAHSQVTPVNVHALTFQVLLFTPGLTFQLIDNVSIWSTISY